MENGQYGMRFMLSIDGDSPNRYRPSCDGRTGAAVERQRDRIPPRLRQG